MKSSLRLAGSSVHDSWSTVKCPEADMVFGELATWEEAQAKPILPVLAWLSCVVIGAPRLDRGMKP